MQTLYKIDNFEIAVYDDLQVPSERSFFEGFFFNELLHLQQQSEHLPYRFYLIHKKKQIIQARCSFFVLDKTALTPLRAPFGGVEFNPRVSLEVLLKFISTIEAFLGQMGVNQLKVRQYPISYAPEAGQLLYFLFKKLGYQTLQEDLNYHLEVNIEGINKYMHYSEQRKFKKCKTEGFIFQQNKSADLAAAYEFIRKARERKAYPMTLDKDTFINLLKIFPHNFLVFEVLSPKGLRAALGIVIRINTQVLYHFYPADHEDFLTYSPLVFLNVGIYNYAQEKGYTQLDLGIATDQGLANLGLIRFKQNLGARISLKTIFSKDLKS